MIKRALSVFTFAIAAVSGKKIKEENYLEI